MSFICGGGGETKKDYLLECNLPFVVTYMEVKAVKMTEPGLSLRDGITVLLWSARYLSISLTSSKVVCLLVNTCCFFLWVWFWFGFFVLLQGVPLAVVDCLL